MWRLFCVFAIVSLIACAAPKPVIETRIITVEITPTPELPLDNPGLSPEQAMDLVLEGVPTQYRDVVAKDFVPHYIAQGNWIISLVHEDRVALWLVLEDVPTARPINLDAEIVQKLVMDAWLGE